MPRTTIRLLLWLIVCLALINETRCVPVRVPRNTRSKRKAATLATLSRIQSGISQISQGRTIESHCPLVPRPRSTSPNLQPPQFQPAFAHFPARFTTDTPGMLDVIGKFQGIHMKPGNQQMTVEFYRQIKNFVLQKVNEDTCNSDEVELRKSGNKCAIALAEFKNIMRKWRGPCADAFIGMCQPWPWFNETTDVWTWKCSFFMKTSPGYDLPMSGYFYKMEDCINALSPEAFENDLNQRMADSWIVATAT